jgi:hypothetical protein
MNINVAAKWVTILGLQSFGKNSGDNRIASGSINGGISPVVRRDSGHLAPGGRRFRFSFAP